MRESTLGSQNSEQERPLAAAASGGSGRERREGRSRGGAAARGGASPDWMERVGAATPEGDMPGFLLALQSKSRAEAPRARVQEQDLRQWGLTGQWLQANFRPRRPTRWDSPRPGLCTRCQERSGGAAGGPSRRFQTYRHQGLPFPPLRRGWAETNSALCRRAGPGEGELVEARSLLLPGRER